MLSRDLLATLTLLAGAAPETHLCALLPQMLQQTLLGELAGAGLIRSFAALARPE